MIYVFLANGFEEIEALTPVDLLKRAGLEVQTVAVGSNGKTVVGSHKIGVVADILDAEFSYNSPEAVILPGGMPGTINLEQSPVVADAIRRAMLDGALVCAICAAPSILGNCGYLHGKMATCFPGFEQYLNGATALDERVVRDGNIITAKGMGCATEFALCIIEALLGKEKADEVAVSAIIR